MSSNHIPESLESHIGKAAVLVEALPYIQGFRGQTFLIKVGGSAMDDPALVQGLMRDIVFMEAVGINPVIVHGGGKKISKAMKERGLKAEFVNGLRVTTAEAIGIVEEKLSNEINPKLVEMLTGCGGKALGISGRTVFRAKKMTTRDASGAEVDLGFVGKVCDFELDDVHGAISGEIVPVVSPLAEEIGTGDALNVNADIAASALAGRIGATKILFLSDVRGVMRDPSRTESLIPSLSKSQVEDNIESGVISGGMIPKVNSALEALDAGVEKAHLIDGRIPHSLLLEIFTTAGIGTMITN